jgi:hypothetical protein
MSIRRSGMWPIVLCCLLAACGGGGGGGGGSTGGGIGGNPPNPPSTPVAAASFVKLTSDTGDFIGEGQKYSYTQADAVINVTATGRLLIVEVRGDDTWTGYFELPTGYANVATGTFNGLTRHGFHDPVIGGLSWSGNGRGCNTLTGMFTLKKAVYEGNSLAEIDLQFTQYCEGVSFALKGDIYWNAKDKTSPPGPAVPPSGLWRPAAGITPASGNFVYLESEANEYVGDGRTHLYTPADAVISVNGAGVRMVIEVNGYEQWTGSFEAMNTRDRLEPGYYGDLQRYPFHNVTKGGLNWSGDGRGCNRLNGWFVVDRATYSGSTLTAIDLRFEQHCDDVLPSDDVEPALRGQIHWNASDSTLPTSGPVAPPAGLWQPSAGITPATGNYVYLESQPGDFIGQGRSYLYTPADAVLAAAAIGTSMSTTVVGDERWGGYFQPMNSLTRLEVGYYDHPRLGSNQSPVRGGFHWSGESRGCNAVTGWFVVDSVTYSGTAVVALDLRFEQHCEGAAAALRGKIHWTANETTTPPGPVAPPLGTWQPAPGTVPATGNYVYLESQPGDFIGGGRIYLYTQADAVLTAQATAGRLVVGVAGDQNWGGGFEVMSNLSRLEVGYYGDVQRYLSGNPLRGGLVWSGEGRACNQLTGWFVVDDVVYSGTTLMSIDLRFEQHCEGGIPALRGSIHWDASDTTAPPGPVAPPAGTWQPAPGATPATGNYIYLESQPGDFIGLGQNYLYTQANAVISLNTPGAHLAVSVRGDQWWHGDFEVMNSLSRLEVGYYGNLQRYPFHNQIKGGLNWSGEGRGCNVLTGWFVVDQATYVGTTLTAVDLRFEQHCEGNGPALRGKIHWDAGGSATPPGPIPPPAGLWQPPPGATPATGNYVYLASQALDFIGQGKTYLYTAPGNPSFAVSSDGAYMHVIVGSGVGEWNGDFQAMNSLSRLEVGYYGDLLRYPFNNPTKGGLNWSGQGRGCSTLTGWFVVDAVTYAGSTLMSIDLRFEQRCDGSPDVLRGKFRWAQ